MSGAQITSSNDDASFTKANRKQLLADSGTSIQAATKAGAGQLAFSTVTGSGLKHSHYWNTDITNNVWIPHVALLYAGTNSGIYEPAGTTHAESVEGNFVATTTTGSLSVPTFDNTNGRSMRFTTGAGSGDQSGFRHANGRYTIRKHNPYFKVRFAVNETSNIRMFMGLLDTISLVANSNDALNGIAGIGLGIETTSGVFRIWHNDSAGATVSDSTGVTIDTAAHIIAITADDTNTRFFWDMDEGTASGFITTEIPAQTTGMCFQATYTTTTAVARSWDIYSGVFVTVPN